MDENVPPIKVINDSISELHSAGKYFNFFCTLNDYAMSILFLIDIFKSKQHTAHFSTSENTLCPYSHDIFENANWSLSPWMNLTYILSNFCVKIKWLSLNLFLKIGIYLIHIHTTFIDLPWIFIFFWFAVFFNHNNNNRATFPLVCRKLSIPSLCLCE